MALREIFARFGVEFDDGPLKEGASSTDNMTGQLQKLGALLAGGFVVRGIRNFVSSSAAIGDELDKTGRVIGISSESLQSWRFAANLSGVSAGDFSNSLIRLQRNAFDASEGMAAQKRSFDLLGISVTDADGNLREIEDILPELADGLQGLENPSERVALLNTLMGRSGARLAPLFEEGAAGVAAMRAELTELGGGASQDFIQASAEITDAVARQEAAMLALRSKIGVVLLPIVQRGTDAFTRFAVALGEFTEGTQIVEASLAILGTAAVAFGIKTALAFGPALAAVTAYGIAVALAVLIVEDLFTALDGGDSILGDLNDSIADFIALNEDAGGVIGFVANVWKELLAATEAGINAIAGFLGFDTADETPAARQRGVTRAQAMGLEPTVTLESERASGALAARPSARGASAATGDVASGSDFEAALAAGRSRSAARRAELERQGAVFAPRATASRARAQAPVTIEQNNPISVTVSGQGLNEEQVGRETARAVRRELDANAREALEALEGQAET